MKIGCRLEQSPGGEYDLKRHSLRHLNERGETLFAELMGK